MSSHNLLVVCLASLGGIVLGALLALAVTARARRQRREGRTAAPLPAPVAPSPVVAPATPVAAAAPAAAAFGNGVGGGAGAGDVNADAGMRAELARERAELDQRLERATRTERTRNLLLSKMSHDLRTPLNSIITLSQLLVEGNTGPLGNEQRQYVEVIHRGGESLLTLLSTILDLSSLEAGRLEVELAAVDVRAVLHDAAEGARRHAVTKRLAFRATVPRRPLFARADEDRLRQALAGLLEEAVNVTTHGYVELTADEHEGQVRLRITDTGPGLSAETRDLAADGLFLRVLESAEPLSQRAGGASPSLALMMSARLVALMGGTLTAEGAPGEGTTFTVLLPAAPADAALVAGAEGAADAPLEVEALHGRVLVIEDNELERRRLADLIEKTGLEVQTAASGQEGLALLAAAGAGAGGQPGSFDAVVLDLIMPGTTGLDVLRAAARDERLAGLPFIVVSAMYMTRSEREVLGRQVVAVVRKGEGLADELRVGLRQALEARTDRPQAAHFAGTAGSGGGGGGSGSGSGTTGGGGASGGSGGGRADRGSDRGTARGSDRGAATGSSGLGGAGARSPTRNAVTPIAHVLIVDDNADNLFSLQQVLAPLPVVIETASSGAEAIAACRQRRPDLIVMDVELPGPSGLETARAIRALPDCADIPVIALTAHEILRGDRDRYLADCSGYLSKPVEPKQVVSAVTRALHIQLH